MKIDAPLSLPENYPPEKVGRSGSPIGRTQSTGVGEAHDEAQLSVDRDRVETLRSQLSRLPEVRQERVETVRQAIRGGHYQVSDQQIVEAIHSQLITQSPRLR